MSHTRVKDTIQVTGSWELFPSKSQSQQPILMKYHALFVTFEKVSKFEIVVCCEL